MNDILYVHNAQSVDDNQNTSLGLVSHLFHTHTIPGPTYFALIAIIMIIIKAAVSQSSKLLNSSSLPVFVAVINILNCEVVCLLLAPRGF